MAGRSPARCWSPPPMPIAAIAPPKLKGFAPTPTEKLVLPFPSILVASGDERPRGSRSVARAMASFWGSHFVDAGRKAIQRRERDRLVGRRPRSCSTASSRRAAMSGHALAPSEARSVLRSTRPTPRRSIYLWAVKLPREWTSSPSRSAPRVIGVERAIRASPTSRAHSQTSNLARVMRWRQSGDIVGARS